MTAVSFDTYDRLVNRIYEAALDQQRWPLFIDDLARVLPGARIALHAHDVDARHNLGQMGTHPAEFARSYRDHYSAVNAWAPVLASVPLFRASEPEPFLPREDLLRSEFYNDWLRPQGLVTASGIVLHRDPCRFLALTADIEARNEARTKARAMHLLDHLSPHLQRAFKVIRQLAGTVLDPLNLGALDDHDQPIFVLDGLGRLADASAGGQALLREGDILRGGPGGRLHFADAGVQHLLEGTLHAVAGGKLHGVGGHFSLRSGADGSIVQGTLVPCRPASIYEGEPLSFIVAHLPVLMIVIGSPPPAAGIDALAEQFGLSPAELRIAGALYGGGTLQQYAEERGISIHTARNQLKSLMAKAGVTRQSQLVAMFASLLVNQK